MSATVVTERDVLTHAKRVLATATERVWISSAWIRDMALGSLLRAAMPRLAERGVDVRVVYRLSEPKDFVITQFTELDRLVEEHGVAVRFSRRLHAKTLVVDSSAALVTSSNLTPTAGYTRSPGPWQNEEVGVLLEHDTAAVDAVAAEFARIWDAAEAIDADTVGIAMDFPTAGGFEFAAIAEVAVGQYVCCQDAAGRTVIGAITEVTGYNPSFPSLGPEMWNVRGAPTRPPDRPGEVPFLKELFAQPNKERAFQYAATFHAPEAMFCIASVEALRQVEDGQLRAPTRPIAPGATVRTPAVALLEELVGGGDVAVGSLLHHPEIEVCLKGSELCSTHLSVLGQTGSGKSNAVKVLLRRLSTHASYADRRFVVLDPHGEYLGAFPAAVAVHPQQSTWVFDEQILAMAGIGGGQEKSRKTLDQLSRRFAYQARAAAEWPGAAADEASRLSPGDAVRESLETYADLCRQQPRLCLRPRDTWSLLHDAGGHSVDFADPGVYVVDLRGVDDAEARGWVAAAVATQVYERAKGAHGSADPRPAVLVYEEAQVFLPEDGYSGIEGLRAGLYAGRRVTSEGRKFDVSVILSTQRPARVDKSALSQCNSQIILRLVSKEDLDAVAGSFEAASAVLLGQIPALDTGVGVCAGTALATPVATRIPLFEP